MIPQALSFLSQTLNDFIKRKYSLAEDIVLLSNFLNQDGSIPDELQNRIVLTLVNISEQVNFQYNKSTPKGNFLGGIKIPTKPFNCQVLITANFTSKEYLHGINMITEIIQYFQKIPFYTNKVYPNLIGIEKLSHTLVNLSLEEQYHLWSILGISHKPFALYDLRIL